MITLSFSQASPPMSLDQFDAVCRAAHVQGDARIADLAALAIELLSRAATLSPVFSAAANRQIDRIAAALDDPEAKAVTFCGEITATLDALRSVPGIDAPLLEAKIREIALTEPNSEPPKTRTRYLTGAAIAGGILLAVTATLLTIDHFRERPRRRRGRRA